MKQYKDFINEAKSFEIQEDTINYISAADLKKYLKTTDKFISEPAKEICNWLIDNNASYIKTLDPTGKAPNALAAFYQKGKPKNEELLPLFKNIGLLKKSNRIIEIPVLQTADQFNGIINKEFSPDEVLLDLTTEKGRNEVVKRYTPLVMKMVNSYAGKSTLDREELKAQALLGLSLAMNSYGKKTDKSSDDGKNIKTTTFFQYAAYGIRNLINDGIQNSHMVRIPLSQQSKERKTTGRNTRTNSVSGDKHLGKDKDGNEGKTIFDTVGVDSTDAETNLNRSDRDKIWAAIRKAVVDKFDKKTMDIFGSFMGLEDWGYTKMKNKELAKKYDVVEGNISYYINKVKKFLATDKYVRSLLNDALELQNESQQLQDANDNDIYYMNESRSYENENFE